MAFSRKGDLFVRSLADGREAQLTRTEEVEEGAVWSPDGRFLAFGWFTSTAHEETPDYVGAKLAFRSQKGFAAHVGAVSSTGGPVVAVARSEGTETAPRWADAARIVLQRVSPDLKAREVVIADAATGAGRVLFRDEDPKFWSLEFLGAEPVPSPDGRLVAFLSDRDGWDHVYVVPSAGGEARALTRGTLEASGFAWSPDGLRIAVDVNNAEAPGSRQLVMVDVARACGSRSRAAGERTPWRAGPPRGRGSFTSTRARATPPIFSWSTRRAAQHRGASPTRSPRAWTGRPSSSRVSCATHRPMARVCRLISSSRRARPYPEASGDRVGARGRHHAELRRLAHAPRLRRVSQLPPVSRERGYVVLAVDYRGSIGYGREWRQGHYRDLGGKDYEDIAAGVPSCGRRASSTKPASACGA